MYKELAEKMKHKDTIMLNGKNVEIKVPLKPEIFGVEGMFFSDNLRLYFKSFDEECSDLKYAVIIKRTSLLSGKSVDETFLEKQELLQDTNIDITSYPEGNYIITAKAYKTIAAGEQIIPVYSDAETANFTIIKKEDIHKTICYEDGLAHLKRKGLFNTGDSSFDDYVTKLLDLATFQEGLFLTIQSPRLSTKQYHDTTVTIQGIDYNVVYEKTNGDEPKEGVKKGLLYVPKKQIPNVTEETTIQIKTLEYADIEKTILLDEFIEEGSIFEFGGFFVNYRKNNTSIFMTEPQSDKTFLNVNIIFNNINLATLTCGYEVIRNDESFGLKIMNGSSTNIILNAAGEYRIRAYVFHVSDNDLENPIATCEKAYTIIEPDPGVKIDCPVYVKRGDTLKFDVFLENDSEEISVSLKKYIDKLDGERTSTGYRYELVIPKTLPTGLHILLCEIVSNGKTKRTISKQFEVLNENDMSKSFNLSHYKKIIRNETAFVFSGYNIKNFAILAMESFSKNCHIEKKQLFFFDDNSTDETRMALESRGFSVISWDKTIYNEFMQSELSGNTEVRKEQILLSILKTIKSRYICFIDGDSFFQNNIVDIILNHILIKESIAKEFNIFGFETSNYLDKELSLSNIGKSISPNFLWVNTATLQEYIHCFTIPSALHVKKQVGNTLFHKLFSAGNNLYNNIKKGGQGNILTRPEDLFITEKDYLHAGKASSSIRNKENFENDWEEQLLRIQHFWDTPEIIQFAEEINLSINEAKTQYYEKVMEPDSYSS